MPDAAPSLIPVSSEWEGISVAVRSAFRLMHTDAVYFLLTTFAVIREMHHQQKIPSAVFQHLMCAIGRLLYPHCYIKHIMMLLCYTIYCRNKGV